jgi:hypothetical protein
LAITVENTGFVEGDKVLISIKLSNIQTTEPDPSLFQIPPDYIPWPTQASK